MSATIDPDTPIVFLHAFPLNATLWEGQLSEFGDRRVLAPHLPGFGGRPPADTLEDFAEAVVGDMEAAGIVRAVLVGLSMGGYVAFRVLSRWPERVGGLVLANTRAGADGEEAAANRTAQAERARREGTGWLADALLPKLLGETSRRERPDVVDAVRRMVDTSSAEGVAQALEAMRDRPDSTNLLPGIDVPVLAIAGEEDTLTPPDELRSIAERVPRGRLEVIPGAGHLSNLENAAEFNRILLDFLN